MLWQAALYLPYYSTHCCHSTHFALIIFDLNGGQPLFDGVQALTGDGVDASHIAIEVLPDEDLARKKWHMPQHQTCWQKKAEEYCLLPVCRKCHSPCRSSAG